MDNTDLKILTHLRDALYLLGVSLDLQYDEDIELLDTVKGYSNTFNGYLVPKLNGDHISADIWSACRESNKYYILGVLNFFKRSGEDDSKYMGYPMLRKVPFNGEDRYVLPNFKKGKSVLLIPRENAVLCAENSGLFTDLIYKIPCTILSFLFGDEAFNVSFGYEKSYVVPEYGNDLSKDHVFKIDFPNLFLATPSLFSIWTSLVRKSIAIVPGLSSDDKLFKNEKIEVMHILENIKDYETAKEVVKVMNNSDVDPFRPSPELHTCLARMFPFEFYEFSAKTKDHDRPNIFKPKCWYTDISARGYQNSSFIIGNIDSVKEDFLKYLKEKGDKDIAKGLKKCRKI